jgi:hypothetical protein
MGCPGDFIDFEQEDKMQRPKNDLALLQIIPVLFNLVVDPLTGNNAN